MGLQFNINAATNTGASVNTKSYSLATDMQVHAEEAAKLLRSLANPNRLMILCSLTAGEMSVSALNDCVQLSQSALSQHLAILREENLVTTRRENQTIYYSIPNGSALEVLAVLRNIYCSTPTV